MYSETGNHLEKFDNVHDFERMCADILNALGYTDVVPQAPRGGPDGGRDITFKTPSGDKGLACVTIRQDIEKKFEEDFNQRKKGEFDCYIQFSIAYLKAGQKLKFEKYCVDNLDAIFIPYDIEGIRSLLDTVLRNLREQYLGIPDERLPKKSQELIELQKENVKLNETVTELQKALEMEPKGYAHFRKIDGSGPYCNACWGAKKDAVLLSPQSSKYWWSCPACHNRFCTDMQAYEREIEVAESKLMQHYDNSYLL